MICVKVYRQGQEMVVAACDSDILGKTFRSKDIKIHVSEGFYKGDDGDEELLINRLEMATILNLVGRRTVDIAVRHGFVDPACVLEIGGVPHAQMARMM
ncbi:MAG: hypothetical protein A3K67_07495 [Euryarchaeota archaeon RBG_16_62_10]|nr:MAG: hypothetical protein A3K67_07495 [Euryarchaeota archaeon RBG_16_62_10]